MPRVCLLAPRESSFFLKTGPRPTYPFARIKNLTHHKGNKTRGTNFFTVVTSCNREFFQTAEWNHYTSHLIFLLLLRDSC